MHINTFIVPEIKRTTRLNRINEKRDGILTTQTSSLPNTDCCFSTGYGLKTQIYTWILREILKMIKRALERLFCKHDWKIVAILHYGDCEKQLMKCSKCGKTVRKVI